MSNLWKSDLHSGLEIATFWVERVMKTKGLRRLDHLKVPDGHLYWWQFYSLDACLLILFFALLIIWLAKRLQHIFKKKSVQMVNSVKKQN